MDVIRARISTLSIAPLATPRNHLLNARGGVIHALTTALIGGMRRSGADGEGTLESVAELGASCAARRIGSGAATCAAL